MMITEAQIKAAIRNLPSAGKRRTELKDDGERGAGRLALILRLLSGRVASEWYAVYYLGGERRMSKIGSYPTMSLADARKTFREEYAPAISKGMEPANKRPRQQQRKGTVLELFTAYVESLEGAGRRAARLARYILLHDVYGAALALGPDRPASAIDPDDVVSHLRSIHQRGTVCMAAQTRAYISAAFGFGMKSANDYTSETAGMDWGLKSNPVSAIPADASAARAGERFLSPREYRSFWAWLVERGPTSQLSYAVRLIMATGQRVEEILRATDSGYDRVESMLFWDKTKNGTPHSIPLPPAAVDILNEIRANKHGLFFPNRARPTEPMLYTSPRDLILKFREESGVDHFRPRDLRRTWKTLAGRAGISKEMRDRLQNHARKSDVSARHYDRYDYLPERRAAMAQWGAFMERILAGEFDDEKPAEVVSIGRTAA